MVSGKKRFFFKKGMDIDLWFNTFEFIMVFIAGFTLLQVVNQEENVSGYEKLYFARDSALLANSVYASPGDLKYYYDEDTKKLIFNFQKNKISVYEENEKIEDALAYYPFAEDKSLPFSYQELKPKNNYPGLFYYKSGGIISVDKPKETEVAAKTDDAAKSG